MSARPPEVPAAIELQNIDASIEVTNIQEETQRKREDVRGALAYGLLALLFLTVGAILFLLVNGGDSDNVLTQSVLPTVVALVGTALGFYFGQQAAASANAQDSTRSGGPPPI